MVVVAYPPLGTRPDTDEETPPHHIARRLWPCKMHATSVDIAQPSSIGHSPVQEYKSLEHESVSHAGTARV